MELQSSLIQLNELRGVQWRNGANAEGAMNVPSSATVGMTFERALHRTLVAIAVVGLAAGLLAQSSDQRRLADLLWMLATIPVAAGLLVSIVRDVVAGRVGVDAIALVSMVGAVVLGQPLVGAVVALMYSDGNVLEDFAVARAEKNLRSLVDHAPRVAHRYAKGGIEDVPVREVAIGGRILVRACEVVPVDGALVVGSAMIHE